MKSYGILRKPASQQPSAISHQPSASQPDSQPPIQPTSQPANQPTSQIDESMIAASWDQVTISLRAASRQQTLLTWASKSEILVLRKPAGQPANIESWNRAIESSNHRVLERSAAKAVVGTSAAVRSATLACMSGPPASNFKTRLTS